MNRTIGVILADESKQGFTHDYFSAVLEGFRQKCNELGYNIMLLNDIRNGDSAETYFEQAKINNLPGVLIACSKYSDEIQQLLDGDILIGAIDEEYKNIINVRSDNRKGINEMVEYLISMGHKRMAIIAGEHHLVSSVRVNEFIKVCENYGITIPDEYIVKGRFRDLNQTAYLTEKLLKLPNPPSCILFPDDYAAIGGINAIHARGLVIPEDISITGYDGNKILSKLEPSFTTVFQNTVKIGETAAERMIYHIEHPEDKSYEDCVVDTSLQIGRTVGRVYDGI